MKYIFCLILLLATESWATPILLQDDLDSEAISQDLFYLDDVNRSLSLEDVTSGKASSGFKMGDSALPNFGLVDKAVWFRFRINNQTDEPVDRILKIDCAWHDYIDFYQTHPEHETIYRKTGDKRPLESRGTLHPAFLFNLSFPPGVTTIYLEIDSIGSLTLPLSIMSANRFNEHERIINIFYGALYGLLAGMLLYNLLIYLTCWSRAYIYYVLFLLTYFITSFATNGFGNIYIWPENQFLASWSSIVGVQGVAVCGLLFTINFLHTKKNTPKLHTAIVAFIVFMIAAGVISALFFGLLAYSIVAIGLVSFYVILMILPGIVTWLNGLREARFFVIATFASAVGAAISSLVIFGFLPNHFFLFHSYEFGIMIDVVLLSMALADRINSLRDREAEAQLTIQHTLETAKHKLEATVVERTEELRKEKEIAIKATKLKDKFVSLVSHDLRSPLGAVNSLLDHLIDSDRPKDESKNLKVLILQTKDMTDNMMKMIASLLNISRFQTGDITLHKGNVSLNYLADKTAALYQNIVSEKGIKITVMPTGDETVSIDETLISEAINNIVANAIKFSGAGDTITLFTKGTENGYAAIGVEDNGVGISEDILPDIFKYDIKTTTIGVDGELGTGLGLPYSNEIIAAHGGKILVDSTIGDGTTITILLPNPDYS